MGLPHNAITFRAYQGGNRLWLDCQGYADPRWCTYKQASAQGWQVRRRERASVVEYWHPHRIERRQFTGNIWPICVVLHPAQYYLDGIFSGSYI